MLIFGRKRPAQQKFGRVRQSLLLLQAICVACCVTTISCLDDVPDRESMPHDRGSKYYGKGMLVPNGAATSAGGGGAEEEQGALDKLSRFFRYHSDIKVSIDTEDGETYLRHGSSSDSHESYSTRHSKKSKKNKKNKKHHKSKKHKSKKHKSHKSYHSYDSYYYTSYSSRSHHSHSHSHTNTEGESYSHSHSHSHSSDSHDTTDTPTGSPTKDHSPHSSHTHSHSDESHSHTHSGDSDDQPTTAPINSNPIPTKNPTSNPTKAPFTRPSLPTESPTRFPTPKPVTRGPTDTPSHQPTGSPTVTLSTSPTGQPTPNPSTLPSLSARPSAEPTSTNQPTVGRTLIPSVAPTPNPSIPPTASRSPTPAPVVSTPAPTRASTGAPTRDPTAAPTAVDTVPVKMWINEFHYVHAPIPIFNTQNLEFIEVAFTQDLDLTNYQLVIYNDNALEEDSLDLILTNPLRFTNEGGLTFLVFPFPGRNDLSDTRGGIALVRRNVGTDNIVMDFISYGGGTFTAVNGLAMGATANDVGLTETTQTQALSSLKLTGTGCNIDDFTWASSPIVFTTGVPGVGPNEDQTISGCGAATSMNIVDSGEGGSGNTEIVIPPPTPAPQVATTETNGNCLDDIWINEFHYQNIGMFDLTEFVEIAHTASMDLTGYRILFYAGTDGTVYKEENIVASELVSETQNGITVFAMSVFERNNEVRNGPDALCIVNGSNNVLEFISYGGLVTATEGPATGLTSTDIGVTEEPDTLPQNSLQKVGNGYRGSDFSWLDAAIMATPGRINTGQTIILNDCALDSSVSLLQQQQTLDLDEKEMVPLEMVYLAIVVKFLENINVIDVHFDP